MLRSLFSLAAILLFSVAALGNQFAAMLMYWWFSLFRPHEWMWWDVSAFRLPLLAAFLFFLWTLIGNKLPRFDHKLSVLIGLYGLLVIVSQLVSGCQSWHPILFDHVLILVFVTLASERQLSTVRHVVILVFWAALSFAMLASKAGWQALLRGGNLYAADLGGGALTGSNAVALASGMCIFLLFSAIRGIGPVTNDDEGGKLTLFSPSNTRILRATIPFIVLGLIALVITSHSRGSAISTAGGIVAYTILSPNRIRNLILLVVLVVGFLAVIPDQDGYADRITSAFADEEELDNSAASRPHFWTMAQNMANDNVLGVGVGCFVAKFKAYDTADGYYGNNRSVHSSHFGILAELGYPGLLLWLVLNVVTILELWRIRKRTRTKMNSCPETNALHHVSTGLLVALLVFIGGGSFYELTYNDFTWLIFAMTIACSKLSIDLVSRENPT